MLKFENVCFSYDTKPTLLNISFCLKKEEIACLLGESGSGKTSVLRLIAGLEVYDRGEIFLRGSYVKNKACYKRNLGFVFQELNLFPHLNVLENLEIKKKCPSYLIESLSLETLLYKYPHEISGGEGQKVALARTLNSSYDLLLLDEPFSHIDKHNKKDLAFTLKRLFKKEKKTVLFVTHSQQEAFNLAQTIGIMKKGRLLQKGLPQEVYQKPQHPFVAQLLGTGFFLKSFEKNSCSLGNFQPLFQKTDVSEPQLFIRPEQLILGQGLECKVLNTSFLGASYLLSLKSKKGDLLLCFSSQNYQIGSFVQVSLKPHQLVVVFAPNLEKQTP